jgi:hypothetical protein
MKKLWMVCVCAFALGAVPALADDAHGDQAAHDEMMKMWEAMSAPGEPHAALAEMAGTWHTNVTMWMQPGTEPMISEGVSENKMTLGGRYLHQNYEGTFMGQPFKGMGFTGYDNYKKQYLGLWMDSMSTGWMTTTGQVEDGNMVFTGTMDDPMSGGVMKVREIITKHSKDHHTFEMWMGPTDAEMFKTMEIQYKRKMK